MHAKEVGVVVDSSPAKRIASSSLIVREGGVSGKKKLDFKGRRSTLQTNKQCIMMYLHLISLLVYAYVDGYS